MADYNKRPLGAHRDDQSLLERLFLAKGIHPIPELLKSIGDIRNAPDGILDLSGRALYPGVVWVCVAEVLATSVAGLRGLLLRDCALPKDAVTALVGRTMARSPTLRVLDLRGNNLQVDACRLLARAIRHCSCLEKLNLAWNALGLDLESFNEFSISLSANWTLHELDLSNNSLPPRTGHLIGLALEKNSTLKNLDLRWNMLGMEGGRAILASIENNIVLRKISLQGNCIPDVITDAVEAFLQRNHEKQAAEQTFQNVSQKLEASGNLERLHREELDRLNDVTSELEHQLSKLRVTQETTSKSPPTSQFVMLPPNSSHKHPLLPPVPPAPLFLSQNTSSQTENELPATSRRNDFPLQIISHQSTSPQENQKNQETRKNDKKYLSSVAIQATYKTANAACQIEDTSINELLDNARREIVQITSERNEARNMASTTQSQLAAAELELNALRDSLTAVNCLVREATQARQEADAEARAAVTRAASDARAAAALEAEARLASTRTELENLRATHAECPRRIKEVHSEWERQIQSLQNQLASTEARLAEAVTRASSSDHELHSMQTRLSEALTEAQRARLAETDRAARLYAAFAGYWSSLGAPAPAPPPSFGLSGAQAAQVSSILSSQIFPHSDTQRKE